MNEVERREAQLDGADQTVKEMSELEIEIKILHLLSIYPIISPTMLQGGLGPSMKPALWRPVLERLKEAGKVIQVEESMLTPAERYNTYTKLSLPGVTVHTSD